MMLDTSTGPPRSTEVFLEDGEDIDDSNESKNK
jgi:hypothetical protein